MAKMLNYRFRHKVTAPFRATACFELVTYYTHIKRADQQWAAAMQFCFTCEHWSACPSPCIIPAGSPFLSRESLDPAKCFLHLWMQLWATGCTVPNTACWRWLEFYSAGVFFSFLHVNISAKLSVDFLAAVALEKKQEIFCDLQNMEMGVSMSRWKQCLQNLVCRCFLATQQSTENATVTLSVRSTAEIQTGQCSKLVLNSLLAKKYSATKVPSNF